VKESALAQASDNPRPFDVRTIRYLIRLMAHYDLSEIDLREGDLSIRLRRGQRVKVGGLPMPTLPTPTTTPPAAAKEPTANGAKAEEPPRKLHEIKSPTVGTFYAQKEPGAPPFVSVGSRVTPDTVVCVIEAMKLFNEITADCSGVIVEVVASDKQPIEYGTALFRVDLAG
jgi:acetyl-CoA carboxylase biotin carboxyl carrier protein